MKKKSKLLLLLLSFYLISTNSFGQIITNCKNDSLEIFKNKKNLIKAKNKNNNKYGFIDNDCKIIIPFIYDWVVNYENDFAIVVKSDKYGLIDKKGNYSIDLSYDQITYSDFDKIYILKKNNTVQLLDENLKKFSKYNFTGRPFEYGVGLYSFKDGLMCVQVDSLYGFLNRKGEFQITPRFKNHTYFYKGYAIVGFPKKGLINKQGNYILKEGYDDINHKYGCITANKNKVSTVLKDGNIILDSINGYVQDINRKHIIVIRDNGMSILNFEGIEIFKELYNKIDFELFAPGVTLKKDELWGYYDLEQQKLIVPVKYDKVEAYYGGSSVIVNLNGKYGLFNKRGKEILNIEYDNITAMTYGVEIVKNNKYGLYTKKNKKKFPIIYDDILYNRKIEKFKLIKNGKSHYAK